MVKHQTCGGLVNASAALCGIEQEVKAETANIIAEISAELQRERQKNAQLLQRISLLEALIQERDGHHSPKDICLNDTERYIREFKRQKIERRGHRNADGKIINRPDNEMELQINHETCMRSTDENQGSCLVNWMSMDDETLFLHFDKVNKNSESAADFDESEDEDGDGHKEDHETTSKIELKSGEADEKKMRSTNCEPKDVQLHEKICFPSARTEAAVPHVSQASNDGTIMENSKPFDTQAVYNQEDPSKDDIKSGEGKAPDPEKAILISRKEVYSAGSVNKKKPGKVPFCPKEVKRILESQPLLLKNAQSHTIRKIVVFASLGVRHGCEDMYELDFNHFTILRKGEPFVSKHNPGEHVLYENPGVRRKVFYPNRQNPALCPVQILEEEKAMRPSDRSCPSCLFLCIKYGGTTRNLPQNEYVRQQMGRNKLKSFGPVMCRMAMLVHFRSGSFFFKALGITLLFMAGFPDDLVRRETKYRNLDLLQKYYRTDTDAGIEELFLLNQSAYDSQPSHGPQQLNGKTTSTKSKVKKQSNTTRKPESKPRSSIPQPRPSSAMPSTQFGLMGYASMHGHPMTAFQSMPSQSQTDSLIIGNLIPGANIAYNNQTPSHIHPTQPTNTVLPKLCWPQPNVLPPGPFPITYGYQSFPATGNYISMHPRQIISNNLPSCCSYVPKVIDGCAKSKNAAWKEPDADSASSSSSTHPKEAVASCK